MRSVEAFQSFQTQDQALEYLEKVRWKGKPACPYCTSDNVGRHASSDRANQRWQCRSCNRAFAVTVGTIFHRTHVPLRNWYLVLALTLKGQHSASAYQIARDLGMRRPTVWSMMQRIRIAMETDKQANDLLRDLVEPYEKISGGKIRSGGSDSGGGSKRGQAANRSQSVEIARRRGISGASLFHSNRDQSAIDSSPVLMAGGVP